MKKYLLFAALAALALASCQSDDALTTVNVAQNNETPVNFSAYSTSAVTSRGAVATTNSFKGTGIGVFAFYQPAVNGVAGADYTTIKYPTPNFMYNQKVKFESSKWSYTPVKYWPNNKNDKLSFFAYAPYDSKTTWEDLGISTDATGKTITKTFDIYNDVADQQDYLFAAPTLNMLKPATTSETVAGTATDGTTATDVVKFDFTHVTSKVNLFVGVNVDKNPTTEGSKTDESTYLSAWTDANTTIEIKSIEFKDLATTLTCKYNTSTTTGAWSADGEQDIKVVPSSVDHAEKIDNTNWSTAAWHRVLACADATKPNETTDKDQYMFIAPQELSNQEIVITYVVKTTDSKLNKGQSEITNVMTFTWEDFKNAAFTKFEAGKQYRLYFLIGMQSVKVAATITDWDDATTDHVVDVPAADADATATEDNEAFGEETPSSWTWE